MINKMFVEKKLGSWIHNEFEEINIIITWKQKKDENFNALSRIIHKNQKDRHPQGRTWLEIPSYFGSHRKIKFIIRQKDIKKNELLNTVYFRKKGSSKYIKRTANNQNARRSLFSENSFGTIGPLFLRHTLYQQRNRFNLGMGREWQVKYNIVCVGRMRMSKKLRWG